MQKRWSYLPIDIKKAEKLQEALGTNPILCELLVQRDIFTYEEAKEFFRPNLENLHNPFEMKGMRLAVDRIIQAVESNQKILIYGDYDVDGTTSVALLCLFLKQIGVNCNYYIPNRYKEGYGVSIQGINYAIEHKIDLIITIDCGVTAIHQIELANQANIDVIVCDHHLPTEELPKALAILNPKQIDCPYPYKELSGCGIGLKLCSALAQTLDMPAETYLQFIDLVTVSIASDIVPITGENRIIAYYGLKKINSNPEIGLKSLIDNSGLQDREITITDLVFFIGPKINAPGRMERANASVEILMSQSKEEANKLFETLDLHNQNRKESDLQIFVEAMEEVDENPQNFNHSIVLYNKEWSKGVIGIVASRMVERYYKPTIIFAEKDGVLTGSARSIAGFNIYEGIKKCQDQVIQFGGHEFAAGLTIYKDNIDLFRAKFDQTVDELVHIDDKTPEIVISKEISFNDITLNFYNLIHQMSPFGPQNMQPVFSTSNVRDNGNTTLVGKDKTHIKFGMKDSKGIFQKGIAFGLGDQIDIKRLQSEPFDICYTIQINEFKGSKSIDLFIKDLKFTHEQSS